jgi:hypothetical protein
MEHHLKLNSIIMDMFQKIVKQKKMKTFIILVFALGFKISAAQEREYKMAPIQPNKNIYTFNDINIFETYELDSLKFLFGWTEDTARGPKMLVLNKLGKVIFSTSGRRDSYIFRPTFFRTPEEKDPVIMIAESGTDYSWGNTLFSISKDQEITYIGEMDVAANSSANPTSIAPYIHPVIDGDMIQFNFLTEKLVLNPGTHQQMVLNGTDISFLYKERRLKLKIN